MSTNYYLHYNFCDKSGKSDIVHIGKYSCGWKFMFHYHEGFQNVEQYKQIMQQEDAFIVDEYYREMNYDDFWQMVNDAQEDGILDTTCMVINGYNFCDCDFS